MDITFIKEKKVKVLNEGAEVINNESLPKILTRIFAVCKEDPNFNLREQIEDVENSIIFLETKLNSNGKLLDEADEILETLKKRVDNLEQRNFETKSRLLEELGSEL